MSQLTSIPPPVAQRLDLLCRAVPETQIGRSERDAVEATVPIEHVQEAVRAIAETDGARPADLFGVPEGDGIALRIVYALDREAAYLILVSHIQSDGYPSISDVIPGVFTEECELYEQFGVRPATDRPLNRVAMPPFGENDFPLLIEGRERAEWSEIRAPHYVRGEAFEFPFGPVRAAGWESLYMGLVTTGEEVLDIFLFHWHKHRGIQRRIVGLTPDRALFFVERTEGLCAVANSWAFCRAVEAIQGVQLEAAALRARAVARELERIYNHAAAVAALCQTTGLSVGQAGAEIVLEELLRVNLAVFGHRYLFGTVCIGGAGKDPDVEALRSLLPATCDRFREVTDALLKTNSFVDRLEATGRVTTDTAIRLGLVGPVARASGIDTDSRRDHPHPPFHLAPPPVETATAGDCLARLQVMVGEVEASRSLALDLPEAATGTEGQAAGESASALGWCESARGESLAWVQLDAQGRIEHARLRPATFRNWRAFDDAARAENVFTDIPIIEASFWLTVAGFAR